MKAYIILLFSITMLASGCRKDDIIVVDTEGTDYSDWSESTHGSSVYPDYSIVFNQNEVLRFDIVISSDNYTIMQDDLDENLGNSGGPGGGGGGFGKETTSDYNPVWVPCSFNYEGTEWFHVGIRYKGNSSLSSAYQSGNNKLSLKLDFDQFEDAMPDYPNQRFYGFKQLNLNNNYDDASMMREKVGADLFREFGLASAQTSFCVVYVDFGNGPQYFGVYTIVEEVDDTVLDSQFSDGSGNLYKPDGDAASFAEGTFAEGEMEIKTNEELADYTDVQTLYDVINSSDRTSNPDAWKASLESIFDVDTFIKWMAANTTMQNWDTYGIMTHNYYLYNNPSNNKITWVPWDNNEALQEGKMGGALSLSLYEVNDNWPLLRYIKDTEEYNTLYNQYLQQFVDEVFIPSKMISTYENYNELLHDYAYAEEDGYTFLRYASEFDDALYELESHVQTRNNNVESYLSK